MTSEWATEFRKRFGEILTDNGLLPRARRWYRDGEELIAVVDLQKSQYGDLFYINVGLSIPELDGTGRLSVSNSAISFRLEHFAQVDIAAYHQALVLASGMSDERRDATLRRTVSERLMPRLSGFTKVSDLKSAIESDRLWRAHSPIKTRRFLGLEDSA